MSHLSAYLTFFIIPCDFGFFSVSLVLAFFSLKFELHSEGNGWTQLQLNFICPLVVSAPKSLSKYGAWVLEHLYLYCIAQLVCECVCLSERECVNKWWDKVYLALQQYYMIHYNISSPSGWFHFYELGWRILIFKKPLHVTFKKQTNNTGRSL